MKAIEVIEKGKAEIREVPKPSVRDGWLLVKVKAVGINPADWKSIDYRGVPGSRAGLDFFGVVEEVGENVSRPFKKGDRIAGWVRSSDLNEREIGSFAEYCIVKAHIPFKVPDNISDEEAATLGVSMSTVAQGLYKILGLPWPNAPTKTPIPILIHGGSTATGIYGIQYAKASGMRVITTASPRNFELVKSLGADAVFDYKSPTCAADIRALTGNRLTLAWACAADGEELIAGALSDEVPSKYVSIVGVNKDRVRELNPQIEDPRSHIAYDVFGGNYLWPSGLMVPEPGVAGYVARFLELSPGLLESGAVKPIRTIVNRGGSGLEGVLEGLDELRANGVSAAKLVYTL
ncbi:alcohol dehydrogenase [Hypoxylon cercidicola]|nr:alcohol dehydrogenase [Hypoxylon cercidicola]